MKSQLSFLNQPLARVLQHLAFWFFSFYIFLQVFKLGENAEKIDFVYTFLFHFTLIPAVYLNLEFLIPRLANNRKWVGYTLAVLSTIALFSWLNQQFFGDWSKYLLPDYFFISYLNWWEITLFFSGYMAITSLLKLSKSWFRVNELERQLLLTEKDKVKLELKALRSQIQPHFFFNTLNSIYAMSMEKDERLPATVLQLSDLMRYFLYQPADGLVPLEEELRTLKNYISLQRIRSGSNLDLRINLPTESNNCRIAPFLLITFMENAFKHGAKGMPGAVFIHLDLKLDGNRLSFRLVNSRGEKVAPESREEKGLGLENVRRRIELLYPGKHKLDIREEQEKFTVDLQLDL